MDQRYPVNRSVVLRQFFKENMLQCQLDSFDDFVTSIEETVRKHPILMDDGSKIKFKEVIISPLTDSEERLISPLTCMSINLTYSMKLDFLVVVNVPGEEKVQERCLTQHMPLMIGSHYDPFKMIMPKDDHGGYFIVKSNANTSGALKRVIILQERPCFNRVVIQKGKQKKKVKNPLDWYAEVKSSAKNYSVTFTLGIRDGVMYVCLPKLMSQYQVPLCTFLFSLGVESVEEVVEYVARGDQRVHEALVPTILLHLQQYSSGNVKKECQEEIMGIYKHAVRKEEKERDTDKWDPEKVGFDRFLETSLLLHLGSSNQKKITFICMMVEQVIKKHLGIIEVEQKDFLNNKRIQTAGGLLSIQFFTAFRILCSKIKKEYEKQTSIEGRKTEVLLSIISLDRLQHTILKNISFALNTGKWGRKTKVGQSETFMPFNPTAAIALLRRLISSTATEKKAVNISQRTVDQSAENAECCSTSQEGQEVGLTKYLASTALISIEGNDKALKELLVTNPCFGPVILFEDASKEQRRDWSMVTLNGDILGYVDAPKRMIDNVRQLRRKKTLNSHLSISYYEKYREVRVLTDGGRITTTMYILEGGKVKSCTRKNPTLAQLYREGIIENVDKDEERDYVIASHPGNIRPETTHMLLTPSAIFAVDLIGMPYAGNDQSPRQTYQGSQGKHAIAAMTSDIRHRVTTEFHAINVSQKPLVSTEAYRAAELHPTGVNAFLALCVYDGINQEDGIVVSKRFADLGALDISSYRVFCEDIDKSREEEVCFPEDLDDYDKKKFYVQEKRKKGQPNPRRPGMFNISKLDKSTGVITKGQKVEDGDVLIFKYTKLEPPANQEPGRRYPTRKALPCVYRHLIPGTVDRVEFGKTATGERYIRIRVVQLCHPEVGDKLATCHAQKGVIGSIVPVEDLPFTQEGITPDIITNPQCMPSRMTIGQLIEMITGLSLTVSNNFTKASVKQLNREMKKGKGKMIDKEEQTTRTRLADANERAKRERLADATPFIDRDVDEVSDYLHSKGFDRFGWTKMTSGIYGTPMRALVFMGPVYLQRLRQRVTDKIHARGTGVRQTLTRQPPEGLKTEGGSKSGVMEVHILCANGGSAVLQDRLFEQSDKFSIHVCNICGLMAQAGLEPGTGYCRICEKGDVSVTDIPYGSKLLFQELAAMNIVPRIITKEKTPLVLPK